MMTRKGIALALIVVTGSTALLAKSIEYPPNNAEFFLKLPDDYRTKTNPDGSVIGIGPKVVIALTAMSGIENAEAAKGALPELAKKFFVETLLFRELQGQGVVDGKIAREGGDGLAIKVLTALGKNSDGRSVAITATVFASEQGHYFIFFTAARPEDKEEANKTSREILGAMTTATNEED
jgi:hypothetical protein